MDSVFITDIQNGCDGAFRRAYNDYHEKLYFYFLHKTKSQDLGEELVQLTFIRLWRFRHTLNTELGFSRQLFRIARTTLIDLLRQKANLREVSLQSIPAPDIPVEESPSAIQQEQMDQLEQRIRQLPPMRRKILSFRMEGYTNQQIADEMSISRKTVENQINRAVRDIRRLQTSSPLAVLFFL